VVAALLDTSIVVDLLRGYLPATVWLEGQFSPQLAIPRPVWLEILSGAENKSKQQAALAMLRSFQVIEIDPDDGIWAAEKLINLGLAIRFGGYDCMIAAVAHRLQQPLYTRNLKHFKPLLAALTVTPY
jgi:predicted nucleic acid-binding protein